MLETLEVDGLPVYKVRMPGTASGWVNINYVRKAAPVEVQAAADAAPMATPAPVVATSQSPAPVTSAAGSPELDASGPTAAAPVVEEVVVAEPPKPTALDLFRERRAKLADLESTWKRVREQPDRSEELEAIRGQYMACLLYTSPSPRDRQKSRMPSSA